jgi:hypothetical protein
LISVENDDKSNAVCMDDQLDSYTFLLSSLSTLVSFVRPPSTFTSIPLSIYASAGFVETLPKPLLEVPSKIKQKTLKEIARIISNEIEVMEEKDFLCL